MRAGEIDWTKVRKILVIRLRSIGDAVLSTPSLIALRKFLPHAQIDVLLEEWVAPLVNGFEQIDGVISVGKTAQSRLKTILAIRREKYDVVFNLHGGTTSSFFTYASGAEDRVGYKNYQYSFLYNHLLSSSSDFWQQKFTHSAEQQLALLGFTGIPVNERPKSSLTISKAALDSIDSKISSFILHPSPFALLHPVAAFDTKQWATENFAETAKFLSERGLQIVAVATAAERRILEKLKQIATVPIVAFDDLTLPEITALASRARIFVGNDSGIAHIAAAVNTPSVVIFGSSNREHWRPWTNAPHEIVFEHFHCQPCAGYVCEQFDAPKCILSVKTESVFAAIENVLKK